MSLILSLYHLKVHALVLANARPECYFYGLVLLVRNAFVALFPVMFVAAPEIQASCSGEKGHVVPRFSPPKKGLC